MQSKNMYPIDPCQKGRMFDKNVKEGVKNMLFPVINSDSRCQKALICVRNPQKKCQ